MYRSKLKGKWDWHSSLTFSPETKLSVDNTRNIAVLAYNSQGVEVIGDQMDVEVPDMQVCDSFQTFLWNLYWESKKMDGWS